MPAQRKEAGLRICCVILKFASKKTYEPLCNDLAFKREWPMENPQLLKIQPRSVIRAAAWGASTFAAITLVVIACDQLWPGPLLGLLFLLGAPAGFVSGFTGLDPKTFLGALAFETVINA